MHRLQGSSGLPWSRQRSAPPTILASDAPSVLLVAQDLHATHSSIRRPADGADLSGADRFVRHSWLAPGSCHRSSVSLRPAMCTFLLYLPSGVHRPTSGLSNLLRSLGSLPHRELLPPAPVIASQPRDFNIPDLSGLVCPASIRTACMTSLPHMRSRIQAGSNHARNPSATLGFPGNRAVSPGGSVIVS